ncbi:MAG TPA: DUF5127 domain-containing protein, partial [Chitinophagaceae bacterium]|nr:DUF5127 domain-containing protein [Chitinophagaceae bacterium]
MKRRIQLIAALGLFVFNIKAQVYKAPAYPLAVHDPYFSIWSTTDQVNQSITRHWTGAEHSILGLLSVDGKIYKFLGQSPAPMKPLIQDAELSPYSCKYTETKPADDWINVSFDDNQWKTGKGLFGTKDIGPSTEWNSRYIWIRRSFKLQEKDLILNELILKARYDDNVLIYLNGKKIFEAGCCSANKEIQLDKAMTVLKAGENILAMYCENTGGQAYIDGGLYNRLAPPFIPQAVQKKVEITATQTKYEFDCGPVFLALDFLSPLLAADLDLYSRPITYLRFNVMSKDGNPHTVKLYLNTAPDLARHKPSQEVKSVIYNKDGIVYQKTGTTSQAILKRKGDDVRIDWGYAYLATTNESGVKMGAAGKPGYAALCNLEIDYGKVKAVPVEKSVIMAYDDLDAIEYFGQHLQAWWKKKYSTAEEMIKESFGQEGSIAERCDLFDRQLWADAVKAGGETYARLCVLAYRQSLAAHKLVRGPNNEVLFPQKENFSNGSIWTVDVTYPSAPLTLLYNPALLKGMVEPLMIYSES